ncbi:MAG: hypothetical protein ACOCTI_02770 [Phycisphaeraceae bacterium]
MKRFLALTVLAAAMTLGVGCGTTPTYVNIPSQRGDVAGNNPNSSAARKAETAALEAVLAQRAEPGQVAIVLPEGTDLETYQRVIADLGDRAAAPAGIIEELQAEAAAAAAEQAGEDAEDEAEVEEDPAPPAIEIPTVTIGQVDAISVEQIRLRGWDGEVDITRPLDGERRQLVTVKVNYAPFGGWGALDVRVWQVAPEELLRMRQQ